MAKKYDPLKVPSREAGCCHGWRFFRPKAQRNLGLLGSETIYGLKDGSSSKWVCVYLGNAQRGISIHEHNRILSGVGKEGAFAFLKGFQIKKGSKILSLEKTNFIVKVTVDVEGPCLI